VWAIAIVLLQERSEGSGALGRVLQIPAAQLLELPPSDVRVSGELLGEVAKCHQSLPYNIRDRRIAIDGGGPHDDRARVARR
jgi:hypothetical protein